MSKTKGVVKLVVNTDTDPTPQEPSLVENETSGIFVHSTNSSVASRLWFSQGTSLSSSFSKLEFDTDIGLKIHTENPVNVVHDASIRFGTRGSERWKIEGLNGSSGDLLPATDNSLKIGRTGFNLNSVFSRQLISDDTLALAASGATKWNIDSSGHFVPTATTQNIGSSGSYLSFVYANQLLAGTGQALYLGSNAGTYKWYIANSSNAALVPNTAGAFDLGTSSNRVGTLYSTNINNSGSLTTGTIDSGSGVITDVIQTRTTASSLSIKTGTSYPTRVTIDSSGNVGIGTTSPSVLLDLASSDPQIKLSRPSIPSGTVDARLATGDDAGIFGTYSNHSIILTTNGTEKLRILQNGRVGINNIAPTRQLDINGDFRTSSSGAGDLSITHTNVGGNLISNVLSASGVALSLGADGSEAIRVDTSNKVGIGVSSPVARLHVADNFQIGSSATATNNWHFASEDGDGKLKFYNGNYGAGTFRATITSAGNLGIGTSAPSGILHLNKSSGAADIYLGVGGTATGILYSSSSDTTIGSISASPLVFLTGNTEKMRISASGNVGIGGITTPVHPLHIHTISGNTTLHLTNSTTGTTSGDGFSLVAEVTSNDAYVIQRENANLIFRTNNTERLRITNSGNVGIGTTNPIYNLQIQGNTSGIGYFTAAPSLIHDNGYNGNFISTKPAASGQHINLIRSANAVWSLGFVYNTNTFAIGAGSSTDSSFTNPAFSIDTNLRVGIGTSTPQAKLDTAGDAKFGSLLNDIGSQNLTFTGTFLDYGGGFTQTQNARIRFVTEFIDDAYESYLGLEINDIFTSPNPTPPPPFNIDTNSGTWKFSNVGLRAPNYSSIVNIGFLGFNSADSVQAGYISVDGFGGNDDNIKIASRRGSGKIIFNTNELVGGTHDKIEITNGGDFRPIVTDVLELGTSDRRWQQVHATTYYGYANSGTDYGSFINASDIRLKENIEKIENAQSVIMQLNPVKFHWKDNKKELKDSGFIAQEVHAVIPEGVRVGDEGPEVDQMWFLSNSHIIPYLTKALQEAFEEIKQLRQELTELKNK